MSISVNLPSLILTDRLILFSPWVIRYWHDTYSLPFPSLPFPSLPFPSLPFPSPLQSVCMQVLSLLVRYIVESNDERMALLGVSLLQQLVQSAVMQVNDKGWQYIVSAFQQGCSFHSLETLLSDQPARSVSLGRFTCRSYVSTHWLKV